MEEGSDRSNCQFHVAANNLRYLPLAFVVSFRLLCHFILTFLASFFDDENLVYMKPRPSLFILSILSCPLS